MYPIMNRSNSTPRVRAAGESRQSHSYAPGERIFLAVPRDQIATALALGAKLDRQERVCFIHNTTDPTPFARWIVDEATLRAAGVDRDAVIADFKDAMERFGLVPVDPIADGRWHCSPLASDKGEKIHQTHGGYRLSLDGVPSGYIRNFKGAKGPWRYAGARLTTAQRVAIDVQNRERQALAQQRVEAGQKQVAGRILGILVSLAAAGDREHGYLRRKGVAAHGIRLADGMTDDVAGLLNMEADDESGKRGFRRSRTKWLVIPGRDVQDNLLTVQAIDEQGNKMFASGARKKGAFHLIGVRRVRHLATAPAVLFCEGYATGASLHEATGLPVVVAFDAGNLVEVARQLAPLLPAGQTRIVCADNDQFFMERAIAKIAAVQPLFSNAVESLSVLAGANDRTRAVTLCGLIADGSWQQGRAGKYRLTIHVERHIVCGVTLDVVTNDGKHVRQTARNAGVDAGSDAARILAGVAVTPIFASLAGEPTDFNDLDQRERSARVIDIVQTVLPYSLEAETA